MWKKLERHTNAQQHSRHCADTKELDRYLPGAADYARVVMWPKTSGFNVERPGRQGFRCTPAGPLRKCRNCSAHIARASRWHGAMMKDKHSGLEAHFSVRCARLPARLTC